MHVVRNNWCLCTAVATFLFAQYLTAATTTFFSGRSSRRSGSSRSLLSLSASTPSTTIKFSVDERTVFSPITTNRAIVETPLHRIKKRSSQQQQCRTPPDLSGNNNIVISNQFNPPENGKDYDTISMLWTGEDNSTRVIGLMHSTGEVTSSLYFSTSQDKRKFDPTGGLEGVTITIMERNPVDRKHVLAIGVKESDYVSCVSQDSGRTFACHPMLENYRPVGTLLFKGTMVMTIMQEEYVYIDGDSVLVLSTDSGITWNIIHHQVTAALYKEGSMDTVFALTRVEESSPFSGYALNFFGMSMDTQLRSVNISNVESPTMNTLKGLNQSTVTGFQYAGDFLHVVIEDDDGHKVLKISNNHGESFIDTHLPVTSSGQYINILNTDNKLIFAHVTSATDSNVGTLYTSGANGTFYTMSLDNHVSDDFYNVVSMDGVYLTTQQMDDKSLHTLISMDRGAEWKPITVKNCKTNCNLQIYGKFLIDLHKKNSADELAQGPHSSENARGLIVVQGIRAPNIPFNSGSLKYQYSKTPGVFISGDGGYSWIQADGLEEAFHMVIEDSGGVIQALPRNKPLSELKYSVDEGTCWYTVPVEASLTNFTIKGLVAQPGQKSLNLGIVGYGTAGRNKSQITWEIIDVDFQPILKTPCTSSDMEPWDADAQCYLGKKRSYDRIKKASWCYLEQAVNVNAKEVRCPCSRADYECDYGFTTDPNDDAKNCIKDLTFNNTVSYCLDKRVYTLESSGYRMLPGDDCDRESDDADTSYDPTSSTKATNKACDEGDIGSYLDTAIATSKVCGPHVAQAVNKAKSKQGGQVAAIVILTLISTVLCVALTALYCKYNQLRRHNQYGAFDDPAWSVGRESTTINSSTSASTDEAFRISGADNGGRSYTRLKETGAESDVDLLNM